MSRAVPVPVEEYEEACASYTGWCTNCESFTRPCTEPDADSYDCPACEELTVIGAEDAMIRNLIEIVGGDPHLDLAAALLEDP